MTERAESFRGQDWEGGEKVAGGLLAFLREGLRVKQLLPFLFRVEAISPPFLPTTSPPPHHLDLKETVAILNEWPWDSPVSSTVRARLGIVTRTLSWISSLGT